MWPWFDSTILDQFMKKLLLLFTIPLAAMASGIKSQPPTLQQLKDVDLMTAKPLIIAKEGVYSCPDVSWQMYVAVQTKQGKVLAPLEPKARVLSTDKEQYSGVCIKFE